MTRPSTRQLVGAFLALALVVWLLLLTVKMPATTLPGTQGSTSSSQSGFPGCSFDGDYTNDKPGACPKRAKRYSTNP